MWRTTVTAHVTSSKGKRQCKWSEMRLSIAITRQTWYRWPSTRIRQKCHANKYFQAAAAIVGRLYVIIKLLHIWFAHRTMSKWCWNMYWSRTSSIRSIVVSGVFRMVVRLLLPSLNIANHSNHCSWAFIFYINKNGNLFNYFSVTQATCCRLLILIE